MADCRSAPADGGHAVVLTNCEPKSLTLLNLWGTSWGNEGSFRIEDHTVLELDVETARMSFYDVFWVEDDLRMLRRRLSISREEVNNHPGLRELEVHCPNCRHNSLLVDFRGSIRGSVCPRCGEAFKLEAFHLFQALYARAGLEVTM
ncbi:unnamed protein product [Clonostachys chloroleuca]|uniref:Uncharacterized protein n=1 Tax=Clonostachys chloroleuca TaxID=1926264 RepID=A0AA35LTU0_9HYPO|nr:unnamed protein product [Clonostachys chloroleuca]